MNFQNEKKTNGKKCKKFVFFTKFFFLTCSDFYFLLFFQGQLVNQNISWGIIISTRSLVLQRVARYHAGNYGCAATNDRGENQSALVNLRIHCEYRQFL